MWRPRAYQPELAVKESLRARFAAPSAVLDPSLVGLVGGALNDAGSARAAACAAAVTQVSLLERTWHVAVEDSPTGAVDRQTGPQRSWWLVVPAHAGGGAEPCR